jgi:hypothetical protein
MIARLSARVRNLRDTKEYTFTGYDTCLFSVHSRSSQVNTILGMPLPGISRAAIQS